VYKGDEIFPNAVLGRVLIETIFVQCPKGICFGNFPPDGNVLVQITDVAKFST
jgi:hypothetical protein